MPTHSQSLYVSHCVPNFDSLIASVKGVSQPPPALVTQTCTNTYINPVVLPTGYQQIDPCNFSKNVVNINTNPLPSTTLINCSINSVGNLTINNNLINSLSIEQIGGILENQFSNIDNATCCFTKIINNINHTIVYCSGNSITPMQLIDCVGINIPNLQLLGIQTPSPHHVY